MYYLKIYKCTFNINHNDRHGFILKYKKSRVVISKSKALIQNVTADFIIIQSDFLL